MPNQPHVVILGAGFGGIGALKSLGDAEPFVYLDKGFMAQVGRGAAVVELPHGATMKGTSAWLAWLGVHLCLLSGAEEKSATFVDWGWTLFHAETRQAHHLER
jgi:NADH dehydrogenase FAD-containing subunit